MAGAVGEPVGRGHRDRVAQTERADSGAQFASAIYLVSGEPARLDTRRERVRDHREGLLRLGREHGLLRNAGEFASFLVAGPVGRQVQRTVDDDPGGRGDRREVHRHLAQPDTTDRAGVLRSRADAVGGGLRVPRLVHQQHHVLPGEFPDHEAGDLFACPVVVEARA